MRFKNLIFKKKLNINAIAIESGNADVLKYVLELGADVNMLDAEDEDPLELGK